MNNVGVGKVAVGKTASGEYGVLHIGVGEVAVYKGGVLEKAEFEPALAEIHILEHSFGEIAHGKGVGGKVLIFYAETRDVEVPVKVDIPQPLPEPPFTLPRFFDMFEAVLFLLKREERTVRT